MHSTFTAASISPVSAVLDNIKGVNCIPPYDFFVVEIRILVADTFTMLYGEWADNYHGTVKITPLVGSMFVIGGIIYTEYIFWCGYPAFNDEHPYFKIVLRPTGWQGSSSGIVYWLQMY